MTYSEAIEIIKMAQAEIQWEYPMEYATAFDMAIQAMELQVAKKPKNIKKVCGIQFGDCPNCLTELKDAVHTYRCPNCTQILDWSEE